MTVLLFVASAAIGTVVRWQIGRRLPPPYTTLVVNLAGSFALGLLHGADAAVITVVGVGGLGALTTFSAFGQELVDLRAHRPAFAVAYLLATLCGGIGLAWVGISLA